MAKASFQFHPLLGFAPGASVPDSEFVENWVGRLPEPEPRSSLRVRLHNTPQGRHLKPREREAILDFLAENETRFYENPLSGRVYHRSCGGGSVRRVGLELHCAKCGILEELSPPLFFGPQKA